MLLFLHADTQLPDAFHQHVRTTLEHGAIAGAFPLRIAGDGWGLRWIEHGVNFRRRLRRHGTISLADAAVTTSARRWIRLGFLRTTLVNQLWIAEFYCGIHPKTMYRWYRQ